MKHSAKFKKFFIFFIQLVFIFLPLLLLTGCPPKPQTTPIPQEPWMTKNQFIIPGITISSYSSQCPKNVVVNELSGRSGIEILFDDECKGTAVNIVRNDGQTSTILLSTEDWLKKEQEQLAEIKKERDKINGEFETVKMELEQVKNSLNQQKAELERINSETETARSELGKIKSQPKKKPDTIAKPATPKTTEEQPEKKPDTTAKPATPKTTEEQPTVEPTVIATTISFDNWEIEKSITSAATHTIAETQCNKKGMELPSKALLMSASQRGVINVSAEGEWCSKLNPQEATVVRSKGFGVESIVIDRDSAQKPFRCVRRK
jgi:hypothetical protein